MRAHLVALATPIILIILILPIGPIGPIEPIGLIGPRLGIAQETDTERQAAREVLRKMDALEKSLDVPALVAKLTAPNAGRDRVVERAKELMEKELLALSDDIGRNPEIGFEEHRSVEKLTAYLKQHDFEVEVGVAGLATAFVARAQPAGSSPHLGIIVEYDALRGTKGAFHGDQHNAQGPVGIAAAIAIAEHLATTSSPEVSPSSAVPARR
jgi:hypothetical protein